MLHINQYNDELYDWSVFAGSWWLSLSGFPSCNFTLDSARIVIILIIKIFKENGIGEEYNILDPLFGYSETSSSNAKTRKKKVRLSSLCGFEGCKTQASFRNPDGREHIYCAKHKLPGMVDFRSRKCEYTNCITNASFNYPGLKKRRFCKLHAEQGMIVSS